MHRPLIAVLGATGAQGGALARTLLADPAARFRVRALTRRPTGRAAEALRAAGAEVRTADLDDVDSLAAGFADAHGVFAVTNFWEHLDPLRELRQAGHIARAARRAEVRHLVWSTLEDTRSLIAPDDARLPARLGRWTVPHFDAKGEADDAFRAAGVPTTFLRTAFYWENLIHFGMGPQRLPDGGLGFVLPMDDVPLPGIGVEDIGACAAALFREGESAIGRTLGIAGEHLDGARMADALSLALGERVRHLAMPREDYARLGFPGAEDLANMFAVKTLATAAYRAARPVETARALHPGLLDFRGWLARHAARIPRPSTERRA